VCCQRLVGLRQDSGELVVVRLDLPHRLIDSLAGICAFRQAEQVVKTSLGSYVQEAVGLIGRRVVDAGTPPTPCRVVLQRRPLLVEPYLGEAQKVEPQHRL